MSVHAQGAPKSEIQSSTVAGMVLRNSGSIRVIPKRSEIERPSTSRILIAHSVWINEESERVETFRGEEVKE